MTFVKQYSSALSLQLTFFFLRKLVSHTALSIGGLARLAQGNKVTIGNVTHHVIGPWFGSQAEGFTDCHGQGPQFLFEDFVHHIVSGE